MTQVVDKTPAKISVIRSQCVPLFRHNVDTDQIIPARFLKGTVKEGFGKKLFYDWRYDENGQPTQEFTLNQPCYAGAKILVAGINFGCGSSREHAPWALKDYGFDAVIAVSFADIFQNNALKNRVLPVALLEDVVKRLVQLVETRPETQVDIDLLSQSVHIPGEAVQRFAINAFWRECLLNGVDEIGYTLQHLEAIKAYEASHTLYPVKQA